MEDNTKQALMNAAEGLLFPSESDYPFQYFEWNSNGSAPLTKKNLQPYIGKPADTPVQTISLNNFFKNVTQIKEWYGAEEKSNAERFVNLKKVLESILSDIKVFKVGKTEIDVFITGKASTGQWIGLSTKVVET